MNKIDLTSLRDVPYILRECKDDGFYEFVTDHDVRYRLGFLPDDIIQTAESYEFIIANTNAKSSPRDAKVRDTVLALVDAFFKKNNNALLYICETSDGKQAFRNRLFQSWFAAYQNKSSITLLSASVRDMDGIDNYSTLIIPNSCPDYKAVIDEFTSTVAMFNNKPQ